MNDFNLMDFGYKAFIAFFPFIFALSFHEFAHGWVAKKKGDNTAELMGRLSLNPIVHADLVGTIILPLFAIASGWAFFGWAKPVPVNPRNLKNPKVDMFWIALAGPLSNVLLGFIGMLGVFIVQLLFVDILAPENHAIKMIFINFIFINMILAAFNMLPLHPLDGGKVLARFLPDQWNRKLEEHQMVLSVALIIMFVTGGFYYLAKPVDFATRWMISFALQMAGA